MTDGRKGNKDRRGLKRRKCMQWYNELNDKQKEIVNEQVSYMICKFLLLGYSINLSKAMTRDDLNLGYNLIDHIGRTSKRVELAKATLLKERKNEEDIIGSPVQSYGMQGNHRYRNKTTA